ncbi:MAG: transcription-repair coupling factor, partial [Prevotella sp.]|nr:transcription-repair coupling factor [Prevotella sp.]
MDIQELQKLYAKLPQVAALAKAIDKSSAKIISLEGLLASSASMVFSAMALKTNRTLVFVQQDADEAGYFYHDLCQIMGGKQVLFFPSSYRRAIKYGQKDPACEILRTEVLTELPSRSGGAGSGLFIVTYPEAIAEMVVTRKKLDDRTLTLSQGENVNVDSTCRTLRDFGFREVDYVYEPGQFALRGSILDVFSYSHEYP